MVDHSISNFVRLSLSPETFRIILCTMMHYPAMILLGAWKCRFEVPGNLPTAIMTLMLRFPTTRDMGITVISFIVTGCIKLIPCMIVLIKKGFLSICRRQKLLCKQPAKEWPKEGNKQPKIL